jgi:hypothetical protein
MKAFDNAGNYVESYSVYTSTISLGSGVPIYISPDGTGNYFQITNTPPGTTYLGNDFSGNTFTIVLVKPQTCAAQCNGQNNYSFSTYPITNATTLQWTGGQVASQVVSGTFNSVAPTFNPTTATTVNGGGTVSINLAVQAKVNVSVIDNVHTSVSYVISGIDQTRRTFYIDFYWIPYSGYMLTYDNNGGTGAIPASVCIANTQVCAPRANTFTNSGMTFAGWSTNPNGPVQFLPGANIPANTLQAVSSNVLYAIWQ